MNVLKQLLRQRTKTLAGILLVAFGVALQCICLGQAISVYNTQQSLDYTFSTIGVPTMDTLLREIESPYGSSDQFLRELPEEIMYWLENTAAENPGLVKCISNPTFSSAYIPELIPDNLTNHDYYLPVSFGDDAYWNDMEPSPLGAPYTCAILEIKLEWIGKIDEVMASGIQADGTYHVAEIPYVEVELEGRILQAIGLQEDYEDPTGLKAELKLILPDMESWDQLGLVEGERYLVYGMDYFYADWAYDDIPINSLAPYMWYDGAISLTLVDYSQFGVLEWAENGHNFYHINWNLPSGNGNSNKAQITQEEYQQRYRTPTIAHLRSTAEDFLGSEHGKLWLQKLDEMAICNQAFAILGVDRIGYLANFVNQRARIVQGRDFTSEELESGAKVCILSEYVAAANGLTVGDSITPRFYEADEDSPIQRLVSHGYGTVKPAAYFFTSQTPLVGEDEYTIVGLYRYEEPWSDAAKDNYAFTPNTIFVPHKTVTVKSETAYEGVFLSVVLENGMVPQFRKLVDEAGYKDTFIYFDQGYSAVAEALYDYGAVVKQLVLIGTVVYGILLVLFLLLYPGMQGRNVSRMLSLGAGWLERFRYVFQSAMSIFIPGTVLGFLIGVLLWESVVNTLVIHTAVDIHIEFETSVLPMIAAAQLSTAALLVGIQSAVISTTAKGMDSK